jgi:hypothetical protein
MKTKLTLPALIPLLILTSCYYGKYERLSSADYYYPEPERTDTIIIIQPVPYPVPFYPNPPSSPTVPTKPRPITNPNNDRKNSETAEKDSPSRSSQNEGTQRNSGDRSISRGGR